MHAARPHKHRRRNPRRSARGSRDRRPATTVPSPQKFARAWNPPRKDLVDEQWNQRLQHPSTKSSASVRTQTARITQKSKGHQGRHRVLDLAPRARAREQWSKWYCARGAGNTAATAAPQTRPTSPPASAPAAPPPCPAEHHGRPSTAKHEEGRHARSLSKNDLRQKA